MSGGAPAAIHRRGAESPEVAEGDDVGGWEPIVSSRRPPPALHYEGTKDTKNDTPKPHPHTNRLEWFVFVSFVSFVPLW